MSVISVSLFVIPAKAGIQARCSSWKIKSTERTVIAFKQLQECWDYLCKIWCWIVNHRKIKFFGTDIQNVGAVKIAYALLVLDETISYQKYPFVKKSRKGGVRQPTMRISASETVSQCELRAAAYLSKLFIQYQDVFA